MHLTEEILEHLLAGRLSPDERNEAVRHLLSRCPRCVDLAHAMAARHGLEIAAGRFRKARRRKIDPDTYDAVFEKIQTFAAGIEERVARERLDAEGLWASLRNQSHPRRLALLAADPSMHTWGLYARLMDAAREVTSAHPGQAVEIAHLALAVANELDPGVYGEALVTDFKAAALALRGNGKRVAEDFEGARADLETALELLKEGTGDPLERASLLSLQASWSSDLGFFEQAEEFLEQALHLYRRMGDDGKIGKILLQQAIATGYVEPEKAILLLDEASDYINSITEPLLELSMRHSLAVFLLDAGRTQEAIGVLEDSRALYRRFAGHAFQLRLRWLEGRIDRGLGRLREAEEAFERLAEEFLDKGLPQEYLLCSLDLAETLYAEGDRDRTLRLCTSLYRTLESWHMHAEGLAVMLLFMNALKEDSLQNGAFLDLARYLRRAWRLPQGGDAGVVH